MNFLNLFNFINLYGLAMSAIMIVPNVIYAKNNRYSFDSIDNRSLLYIERIGKYCSILLMSFNLGILEDGFQSQLMFNYWIISTAILLCIYIVVFFFQLKNENKNKAFILTILSSIIVIQSGILQVKTLLLTFGLIYLIGQLYVTSKFYKNR